jgi:N-acetylmuramoyl-L-alanine amidase
MIRKIFPVAAAVLAGVAGVISAAGAAELRAVALSASPDSAQLTLDLGGAAASSGASSRRLFTLEHPDRLVIDLPHTHLAGGVHTPAASGVVSSVRFGKQPHGTLRVVVELRSALPAHSTLGVAGAAGRVIVNLGQPVVAADPAVPPAPQVAHATHAPGEGDRDVVIAIDAGHGGVDPGAIGHGGTHEKDVTLAIARELAARINAEPGMRAVLTRDRDEFVELRDRIARARAAHADMFVSVHADSIADRSVSGASVYVLSVHGATNEAARVLAERENAADLMGGVALNDSGALAPVLLDATQSEMIGVSATAAELVVTALGSVGEIRKVQVQRAGFVVLKSPAIPSMLVETAYISNPSEERRLCNAGQQARLAEAIARGVHGYFMQNPPDGSRIKQERRSTLASAADAPVGAAP